MCVGAVGVRARRVGILSTDDKMRDLLDKLRGRRVKNKDIVEHEGVRRRATGATFLVLDLYSLLELLCDGDGRTGHAARRVDNDVGQGGIYWL